MSELVDSLNEIVADVVIQPTDDLRVGNQVIGVTLKRFAYHNRLLAVVYSAELRSKGDLYLWIFRKEDSVLLATKRMRRLASKPYERWLDVADLPPEENVFVRFTWTEE